MSAKNDSVFKTLVVAISLCLVCSVMVSSAAVLLKKEQQANAALDIKRNILTAAGLYEPGSATDVDELFAKVESRIVETATGEYNPDIDPVSYDPRVAALDPSMNEEVPGDLDIAGVRKRAKYAKVYLVKDASGQLDTLVLPIRGRGLFSTMYGFIALDEDLKTVVGINFYEQGETPGLGGEVVNPDWLASWEGKQALNNELEPVLTLVKGGVNANTPNQEMKVDALSGATMTSNGVQNLIDYWLGENGFGPYLAKLRTQGVANG